MPSDKKFDLDGFDVDTSNVCTADGGFVGGSGVGTGISFGDSELYESSPDNIVISASSSVKLTTAVLVEIDSANGTVVINNLPTLDPTNTGQLWNDSGTLKVSA